jgi:hypothetical protein
MTIITCFCNLPGHKAHYAPAKALRRTIIRPSVPRLLVHCLHPSATQVMKRRGFDPKLGCCRNFRYATTTPDLISSLQVRPDLSTPRARVPFPPRPIVVAAISHAMHSLAPRAFARLNAYHSYRTSDRTTYEARSPPWITTYTDSDSS